MALYDDAGYKIGMLGGYGAPDQTKESILYELQGDYGLQSFSWCLSETGFTKMSDFWGYNHKYGSLYYDNNQSTFPLLQLYVLGQSGSPFSLSNATQDDLLEDATANASVYMTGHDGDRDGVRIWRRGKWSPGSYSVVQTYDPYNGETYLMDFEQYDYGWEVVHL